MDGVHVAHLGFDGEVIGSNLGDGAHEAAAHHSHAAAHSAAAAALTIAAAISLAGVLAGRRSGTGILCDGDRSECKDSEHCRQKTEFHSISQGGAKASPYR